MMLKRRLSGLRLATHLRSLYQTGRTSLSVKEVVIYNLVFVVYTHLFLQKKLVWWL